MNKSIEKFYNIFVKKFEIVEEKKRSNFVSNHRNDKNSSQVDSSIQSSYFNKPNSRLSRRNSFKSWSSISSRQSFNKRQSNNFNRNRSFGQRSLSNNRRYSRVYNGYKNFQKKNSFKRRF
ncbi:unnamed protein product [Brachionus calyciflorus]|uniref:Uncharacterized protein n=1 Tax=Brachionus calyciflorus TaxID=104777 RepID=A0A814PHF0_9BILA|nr:unnamed protein product [Brachionus calyciflorus]